MKKLILMMGLPRSGKSTIALKMGYPIVSGDAIRMSLHGTPFIEQAERMVHTFAEYMVEALFEAGHDTVVVDDCHVSKKRRQRWRDRGYDVWVRPVTTGVYECRLRALQDGRSVLLPVIARMSEGWEDLDVDEKRLPVEAGE